MTEVRTLAEVRYGMGATDILDTTPTLAGPFRGVVLANGRTSR